MTDREKLCELVCESTNYDCGKHCKLSSASICYSCTSVADYLLDNGVTFAKDTDVPSKWISVEDRLPERKQDVLMYFDRGNMAVGWWYERDTVISFWSAYTDDGWYTDCDCEPLYWMPLPEPPEVEG